MTASDLADRLRQLHHAGTPLVLPNAWDAATARVVVDAGFPVVATTSGGVAASLGWGDNEQAPPDEMFAAVARIARAIDVPVTADIESGYGLPPDEVAARLVDAGAVGCNFEDSDYHGDGVLVDARRQADRIAAIKDAARSAGVDIVLNARVDVFVRRVGDDGERVDLALERARLYAEAGADCVYPITADEPSLQAFNELFPGPVNGMVMPGVATLSGLTAIGLARISFGGGLQRRVLADHRRRLDAIAAGEDPA